MSTIPYLPSPDLLSRFAPLTPVWRCPEILAHVAPDVFGLWDAWEKATGGEREIPYWAAVWPAAVVFARFLLDNPECVRDRTVVDVGCGSGVASIAAVKAGASRVIANDIDAVALHLAKLNADANTVRFETLCANLVEGETSVRADVVLAADLFYERSKADAQEKFLRSMVDQGSTVFLADGGRAFAPREKMQEILRVDVPVNKPLEGIDHRLVRLCRLHS